MNERLPTSQVANEELVACTVHSVGKVLGQLAIVLVYTRTVLTTQYKTQFFKDTAHFQLYYTQKQLSSIILRGDIQRMP